MLKSEAIKFAKFLFASYPSAKQDGKEMYISMLVKTFEGYNEDIAQNAMDRIFEKHISFMPSIPEVKNALSVIRTKKEYKEYKERVQIENKTEEFSEEHKKRMRGKVLEMLKEIK